MHVCMGGRFAAFFSAKRWPWVLAVTLQCLPLGAGAETVLTTSATVQFEDNSNVYYLQHGFPLTGTTDYQHADTYVGYGGVFDVQELWSLQKVFLTVTGTEFRYDRFTELDHTDYKLDAGWKWALGQLWDGSLDILRSRSMVSFLDVTLSDLTLQTEQKETAQIGFHFAPDWRAEVTAYTRTVEEPVTGAPNLQLTETSGTTTLRFLGIAGLTAGVSAGYSHGDYSGSAGTDNPSYHQDSVSLVMTYKDRGASTLDAQAGYTRRSSGTGDDSLSGVTALVDYENQLTGKTSIDVNVSRGINSYISNSGSELDSSAGLSVKWQATYLLGVVAGYTFSHRDLPGQGNNPLGSDRIDHQQYASLKIDYEVRKWLSIKPYANIQTRSSNYVGGNFNSTVFGVQITGTMVH